MSKPPADSETPLSDLSEHIAKLRTALDPATSLALYGEIERALEASGGDTDPPGLAQAMASVGLQSLRAGPRPALILVPSRGEVWRDGKPIAKLGRSRMLFRLLEELAVRGPTADREALYTAVWEQLYLGESSDNSLHVSLNRLRKKLKGSGIQIVPTPLGAFAIEGEPAVLRCHPKDITAQPAVSGPTNITPFAQPTIGREADLSQVLSHMRDGSRMLTIVGTGGAGKTRLARLAGLRASQSAGAPPGGVWFIDLSEQRTTESMVEAIANVLDVSLKDCTTPQAALAKLQSGIAQRRDAWLILDNFEQLVDVAGQTVGSLVGAAPWARFLITSREHLKLPDETVLKLGALTGEESAKLFMERAQAIRPSLKSDPDIMALAASIGETLDGIPLAIELAASRVRLLTPAQILDRLSQALRLLCAPNRSGPKRHSTLRATLQWSWDLLEPWEQATLAQLSVFHGGFTVDAAEAVVSIQDSAQAPWTMDVLEALVDQSMVHPMEGPGDARLTMFRSVQDFAHEKLTAMGTHTDALARHISWAIADGEKRLDQQWTPDGPQARQALRNERDNLFAAHECAREPEESIKTALILGRLLWLTGPLSTISRILDALEPVHNTHSLLANKLAVQRGWLLHHTGETKAGEALLLQTLEIAQDQGQLGLQADILRTLGDTNYDQGDFPEAEEQLRLAAELAGQAGERAREGQHLTTLGSMYRLLNRVEEARETLEAGLAIHREMGDQRYEAIALSGLGSLAHLLGALDEAEARNSEALGIFQATGDLVGESHLLENMGNHHMSAGRGEEAMACYGRSMEMARRRGMILHQAAIATNLAMAHLDMGELMEAEDLLRQAVVAHRSHGRPLYEGASMIRLAMVLLDRGRPQEATPLLTGSIEILQEIAAPVFAAYGRAWLGMTMALDGDMEGARTTIDQADEALKDAKDTLGQALCALLRGHIHPSEADTRIEQARRVGPPTGDHPEGSPAPASQSVDIRLAIRLLERRSG